ncbi:MAG: hypothetical protein AAB573_03080 [Patescibacteria group bacterium]
MEQSANVTNDRVLAYWPLWAIGILIALGVIGIGYYFFFPQPTTPEEEPQVAGAASISTEGWIIYNDTAHGFTILYPPDFVLDTEYSYTGLGSEKEIRGVSFSVPAAYTEGTNLSTDSKLSVEWANGADCTAASFIDGGYIAPTPENSVYPFDVQTSTGAAAGNRYEETVFALPSCHAIRYLIHYGALENYGPGTTRAFDRQKLLDTLDAMRRSLVLDSKG